MNIDVFENLIDKRLDAIKSTLLAKRQEYALGEDVLRNFKEGAKEEGSNAADVLRGYMLKHWVSIKDLVSRRVYYHPAIDEKIGDAICYLILLEAILKE